MNKGAICFHECQQAVVAFGWSLCCVGVCFVLCALWRRCEGCAGLVLSRYNRSLCVTVIWPLVFLEFFQLCMIAHHRLFGIRCFDPFQYAPFQMTAAAVTVERHNTLHIDKVWSVAQ